MAVCRDEAGGLTRGAAGDAPRTDCIQADGGEDGSQGCVPDCGADALGLVSASALQSREAQETRAMLTARKLVKSKLRDVESSLRGILRGFGLEVGRTTPNRLAGRVNELVTDQPTLQFLPESLLAVHEALRRELTNFEKRVRGMARCD